jgi:hypothetical protein
MEVEAPEASVRLPKHSPAFVYFWGPVRSHVNRIALEYARRLHRSPVWLSVPDAEDRKALGGRRADAWGISVYELAPGEDIGRAPLPPGSGGTPELPAEDDLVHEVGMYLQFPSAARAALARLDERRAPRVLILTNVDRLGHVSLLTDRVLSRELLRTLHAHGVTVVLTSQELIRAPPLPMECAFRVDSSPDEPWTSAELWPGVPVAACTTCSASPTGTYAPCSPMFRSVCPLRLPFPDEEPDPGLAPLAV